MKNPVVDRKVRFALVGCGRISENHFKAIEQFGDTAELAAVCDIDPAALRAATDRYKVPGFTNITEMLKAGNFDIVSLCTPSGLHPRQAIETARAGFHVLSEKPMGTKWDEAKEMVRECDKAGVQLFVVKQNRNNTTLRLLKNAVDEGRFGKIYLVAVNVFWTRPQSYYDHAKWRGTWEMDGGAFMNQASHYVDLLTWMVGPLESVHAFTGTLGRKIEAEDTGVMSVKWRSGAMGSVNVTMLTYPKNLEGSITILGERGTARIGGVAVNEVLEWSFDTPHPDDAAVKDAGYKTASVYGFGHNSYYANVIETMRGKATANTDGRDGLKSLQTLIACYRSAREGKVISLPLD